MKEIVLDRLTRQLESLRHRFQQEGSCTDSYYILELMEIVDSMLQNLKPEPPELES